MLVLYVLYVRILKWYYFWKLLRLALRSKLFLHTILAFLLVLCIFNVILARRCILWLFIIFKLKQTWLILTTLFFLLFFILFLLFLLLFKISLHFIQLLLIVFVIHLFRFFWWSLNAGLEFGFCITFSKIQCVLEIRSDCIAELLLLETVLMV